jgi:hypothetical protein
MSAGKASEATPSPYAPTQQREPLVERLSRADRNMP